MRSVAHPTTNRKTITTAMPTGYGHSYWVKVTKPPNAASIAHSPTAKLMMPVGRRTSRYASAISP